MANRTQPCTSPHPLGVPLPADTPRRWTRYVAVGDSLSEGLGDPLPGGSTRGWARLLAGHLRRTEPGLAFTNLAVRGHLTRHALDTQLDAATAADPDLVSIFIGGNDVLLSVGFDPDRFRHELSTLVEPFVGRATIVLSTIPDLAACSPLPPPIRGRLRRRILAANEIIRELADRHATVLYDAWADNRTRRHRMWSIDRIHPSAQGHRLIAASVADLLGLDLDEAAHSSQRDPAARTLNRHARELAWLVRHGARIRRQER